MCLRCAAGVENQTLARRAHVLRLLTLVEQPNALPPRAALRLALEALALSQRERGDRQCDAVAAPGPDIAKPREQEAS